MSIPPGRYLLLSLFYSLQTLFPLYASLPLDDPKQPARTHCLIEHKNLSFFQQSLQLMKEGRSFYPLLQHLKEDEPKCFISYAWGVSGQEKLIHTLANDLKEAGIYVYLDIWHNTAGTGIAQFAENILEDTTDFVVLAGSQKLMEKYNSDGYSVVKLELGMVAQRATGPIHTILPILLEGNHKEVLPKFLWNTVSIGFQKPEDYALNCLNLLGRLYKLSHDDPFLQKTMRLLNKAGSSPPLSPLPSALTRPSSSRSVDILERVDQGDLSFVKRWLVNGGKVNQVDYKGRSLLERAAGRGYQDLVDLLLSQGAEINHEDNEQNTALYMAAYGGHSAIVKKLLEQGAAINHQNKAGVSPLYMAARKGFTDVVELLCHARADLALKTHDTGETPLWVAAKGNQFTVLSSLLKHGARPDEGDHKGITPLLIASYYGHEASVALLLGYKANPDQARDNGITPLIVASYLNHPQIVKHLLAAGADSTLAASAELGKGQALHYALQQDHLEVIQLLEGAAPIVGKQQQEVQKLELLEQQIARLEASLSQLSTSQSSFLQPTTIHPLTAVDTGLSQEVELLKKQQGILWEKHQAEQKLQQERAALLGDASTSSFYTTFQRKLSQLFLAYKVLDTGMFQQSKTKLNRAADGISLLGEVISIPVIKHIPQAIGLGLNFYADRREAGKVSLVARLTNNLSEMEQEVDSSARLISYRYEDQIKRLTVQGAGTLAECGVRRLIEYMRDDKVDQTLALADQLNIALSVHNSHQGRFPFTHRSLEVQGGIKKWTDDGVFRKSGIRTKTGQRYSGPKMKAAKYGYRLGTEQEASSQQLVKE